MSSVAIGGLTFLFLVVLLAIRTPIAVALLASGALGYAAIDDVHAAINVLSGIPGELVQGYSFSVIPLFLLMGVVAGRSNMARDLFEATRLLAKPGARASLATAAIGSCTAFGAICGSSIATAATMTPVALPEMRRSGYDVGFAAGAIAAGGTLGILIPPSVVLIIYALLAEQSIATLFAAALPFGILLAIFCVLIAKFLVWRNPALAPQSNQPAAPLIQKLKAVSRTWKIVLVFTSSLGGIYLGLFSPTEAAAVGAGLALLLAALSGELKLRGFMDALDETLIISGQLFFVFLGGLMFARFVALTQIPVLLTESVQDTVIPGVLIIVILIFVYIVLGCLLETISMMLVTVPVFLPLVMHLGYDPIWFGLLVVVVAEMGLITPPVGLNIFVIRAQLPGVGLGQLFRGVLPFILAHLGLVAFLLVLPDSVSWLLRLLQ